MAGGECDFSFFDLSPILPGRAKDTDLALSADLNLTSFCTGPDRTRDCDLRSALGELESFGRSSPDPLDAVSRFALRIIF